MSWITIHTAVPDRREKRVKTKTQPGVVTGIIEIISIPLSDIIFGSSKPK